MFADWTDRIAAGEVPPAPTRPSGVERNIVITEWNWGDEKTYLHDLAVTDRRNPTVNANGLVYGSPEMSTENTPVLDPATSKASALVAPPQDPKTPPRGRSEPQAIDVLRGPGSLDEPQRRAQSDVRREGPPVDDAASVHPRRPAWCRAGSSHPSAKRSR